jgi:hypothetical protein
VAGNSQLTGFSLQSVRARELPGCLSGEQQPSYCSVSRHNGRRFAVCAPEGLVLRVRRAVWRRAYPAGPADAAGH